MISIFALALWGVLVVGPIIALLILTICLAVKTSNRPITINPICRNKKTDIVLPILGVFLIFFLSLITIKIVIPIVAWIILIVCIILVSGRLRDVKSYKIRESRYKNNDRLVCEGPASISGNRGWMFLSETAIEMYFYPAETPRECLMINFRDFEKVTSAYNRLSIWTYKGTYTFKVQKAKMWSSFIDKTINSKHQ